MDTNSYKIHGKKIWKNHNISQYHIDTIFQIFDVCYRNNVVERVQIGDISGFRVQMVSISRANLQNNNIFRLLYFQIHSLSFLSIQGTKKSYSYLQNRHNAYSMWCRILWEPQFQQKTPNLKWTSNSNVDSALKFEF